VVSAGAEDDSIEDAVEVSEEAAELSVAEEAGADEAMALEEDVSVAAEDDASWATTPVASSAAIAVLARKRRIILVSVTGRWVDARRRPKWPDAVQVRCDNVMRRLSFPSCAHSRRPAVAGRISC
jgi:hypothetical protein